MARLSPPAGPLPGSAPQPPEVPLPSPLAHEPSLSALAALIATVDRLRDPEHGCPWDLEQTHASLIPFVLEEAHEVADAIRHGDDRHLEEELGDLLLQVLLHARLASEEGRFTLEAVARGLNAKLVRRHPHVFGEDAGDGAGEAPRAAQRGRGGDTAAVKRSWEAIKAQERADREAGAGSDASGGRRGAAREKGGHSGAAAANGEPGGAAPGFGEPVGTGTKNGEPGGAEPGNGKLGGTAGNDEPGAAAANSEPGGAAAPAAASPSPLSNRLAGKVRGQPALAGAMTISKKAAAAGFEWDDMAGVWQKVHEELDELKEAVASGNRAHAQEELGDVLFTLVNVARWCGIDPEEGLAGTNRRFLDRFARVEAALGGDLGGRSIRELEGHWQAAKAQIRAEEAQG